MSASSIGNAFRMLAILTYSWSLLFPAFKTSDPHFEEIGLFILLFGWITLLELMTAWLANPMVLFCFFRMNRTPRLCLFLSVAAIVAAHDVFNIKSVGFDSSRDIYHGRVWGLEAGGYLWLGSLIFTLIASLAYSLAASSNKTEDKTQTNNEIH